MKHVSDHRTRCRRHFLSLAVTSLISVYAVGAFASDSASSRSEFTDVSPCPFEAAAGLSPERVTCGYLSVPENRQVEDSAILKLPVAVIHTTAPKPKPDPVIFLAGGPGGSPVSSARSFELFASHAFGADRDIVLYTQRGAALTDPVLDCEAVTSRGAIYLEDQTLEERDSAIGAAAVACLQELAAAGRDLRGYSAQENAQDLVDLRRGLGLKQWNLLAVSYGTLIAIETARLDPEGVRSMLLDSLVSPESDLFMSQGNRNFSYALDRLLDACGADPDCREQFPDLRESLEVVLERLKAEPVTLPIVVPGETEPLQMVVNWHDFLGVIHWSMYNAQTLTLVPLLIGETAAGRYDLLAAMISRVFPGPMLADTGPVGTFFATVCRDQWTARNPLPEGEQLYGGYAMATFLEETCSDPALGYGQVSAPEPIPSDVPTLLLSGRFDPTTPDVYAEQVDAVFSNAVLVRIPDFGHSTLSGYTACQTVLAKSFMDEPRDMAGFPCLEELGPPRFVLTLEQAKALFAPKQQAAAEP